MINLAEVELLEIRRRAFGIGGGESLGQLLASRFSVSKLTELSANQRRECLNLLNSPEALSEFLVQFQLPFHEEI